MTCKRCFRALAAYEWSDGLVSWVICETCAGVLLASITDAEVAEWCGPTAVWALAGEGER